MAVIACSVNKAGELTTCSVEQEAPDRHGFGAAALTLAPKFRMHPVVDGRSVEGGVVRIPIRFGHGGPRPQLRPARPKP